jgi:ubiquinone/menaquinone biosynthesis C-methylase UbiE
VAVSIQYQERQQDSVVSKERKTIMRQAMQHSGTVVLVLWLAVSTGYAQKGHEHHPMPVDQYIARLEDPNRDSWQKPEEVIKALNIREGQVVADIGAGSGYFTLRLARAVGEKGRVFAVDVEEGMVEYLRQRLNKEQIKNVTAMKVPPHDPLLIDGSLDLAFVCDVYHHIEERDGYLRKLRKAIKADGRVVIVDFYRKETPVGPPMSMRLSEETVQKELQEAGLTVTEKLAFLPYQYILIAEPTTATSAPYGNAGH